MKTKIIYGTIAIAAILAAAIFLNQPIKKEGFFIITRGTHDLHGPDIYVKIFRDKNGLLNIEHKAERSTSVWVKGWFDPNQDWFLYVDKINEMWLSHSGDSLVFIYEYEKSSGSYGVVTNFIKGEHVYHKLASKIPEVVRDRLPSKTLEILAKAQQGDGDNANQSPHI